MREGKTPENPMSDISPPNPLHTSGEVWRPIETAPVNTEVLVWWPIVLTDDDGDPTAQEDGGYCFVSELQGDYWLEPDALNAIGDYFGDDRMYAETPKFWTPLPEPPK
jgi:hypothetical protein